MRTRLICLATLTVLLFVPQTRADDKPNFDKWEKEIAALEKRDKDAPPPKNAVLFAGSSSIRRSATRWVTVCTWIGVNGLGR